MALQKQNLTVNVGSLRTDTFEQVLAANSGVLELENCIVNQTGAAAKRNGNVALTNSVAPSGTIANTWQLATHKGALIALSQVSDTPLYKWSPTVGKWGLATGGRANTGAYPYRQTRGPISTRVLPFAGSSTGGASPDAAISGAYACLAFTNGTGITNAIVDSTTGKLIHSVDAANGTRPRMLVVNGCFVVIYVDSASNLMFAKWTIANIGTVGTPTITTVGAGVNVGSPFFDALATGVDTIAVAYQHTDNTIHYQTYTVSTGALPATGNLKDSGGANIAATQCLGWATQATSASTVLLVADVTAGVKGHIFGSGVTANATVSTVIDAAATASVRNVTGWTTGATDYNVLYEITGTAAWQTKTSAATKVGGVVTTGTYHLGVGLHSRPWLGPDAVLYAIMGYSSTKQASYFLMQLPADPTDGTTTPRSPVARMATWIASAPTSKASCLTSMLTFGSGALVPLVVRTRLESGSGVVYFDTAIRLYGIGMNQRIGLPVEAAGSLWVPGGMLQMFDGIRYQEAGWHVYPEGLSVTFSSTGSGLVPGNVHSWIAVYSWTDASGRIMRSVTSDPVQATVPIGMDTALVTVPTARLTSLGREFLLTVELYRLPNGGTAYHRTALSSGNNSELFDSIVVHDTDSDATINSAEFLYTTGGVLSSQPPPPVFDVSQFDNRLWGVSAEDRSLLWFTSQFVDGISPVWNEVLTVRMNDQYGDATGIESMDDKLIVFKERAIYMIHGSGPDALGAGSYQLPKLVAIGDGVAETQVQSIIATSDGIYFISNRGLCLLTRGLQVEYIGQPMQAYTTTFMCTGVVLMPDVTQIRWYSAAGTTIVYDYIHQVWGIHTGQPTSSVVLYNGMPVMADAAGANRYLETAGTYLERGAQFAQKITLPWLQLAGLRGFERLWRVQGIGSCADAVTPIGVTFTYDFDTATAHQQNVTPGVLWNWEARPARQTATSVKLSVRETAPAGQGFVMAGVTFQCGIRPGLKPVAKANRAV